MTDVLIRGGRPRTEEPSQQPGLAGHGWSVADTPMLRVNPTPGRRLGGPALRRALHALFLAERQRAAHREPALDALFALAGQAEGRDRHRLLHLKRAIYNGRDPEPADWHADLPPAVTAWLAATERRALARTAVETGHAAFLAEERAALADFLGSEPFLLSLALSSPQVLDAAQRYRRAAGRPTARDRKSERGLIQHLARAVLRVSPLGRFTAVGFATWSAEGAPLDAATFHRQRATALVTPDRALLSVLVNGILAPPRPGAVPHAVQRNPTLRVAGDRIRFQHVADGRRRVLAAALNDGLATLLRLTQVGPVPVELLAAAAAERLDSTAAQGAELVRAAVEAQILVAAPVLDEQTADPLPAAAALLEADHPEAASHLHAACAALEVVARGSLGERLAALSRVRTASDRLGDLGAYPVPLRVNEDYLLAPAPVSPGGYREALADLGAVAEFSAMFDRHHDARALLVRSFVDRFGPGASVPLLDHAEALVDEVRRRQGELTPESAAELGPPDGSLAELLARRASATAELTDRLRAGSEAGVAEVAVDAGWLAGLAAGLPDRFTGPASHGLLVQPVAGRLVVNACYPGAGQLVTRFVGPALAGGFDAAGPIRRRIERLYGTGVEALREDYGLHGNNLNHRTRLFDDVLTPAGWLGLRLAHDPATDRLGVVDRDGTPIRVLALGMKWLDAQPAPLLVAVWLYGSSLVAFDPVQRAHAERAGHDPRHDPTIGYPRLVAGRTVLHRRRWYPGADLPMDENSAGEHADLLAITGWRAAHDVPEEVVIKTPLWRMPSVDTTGEGMAAQIRDYVLGRRREKPQYVDLASALMVRVLPRLMERRTSGYVEEALPSVRTGEHASEWAIELDRYPGGQR